MCMLYSILLLIRHTWLKSSSCPVSHTGGAMAHLLYSPLILSWSLGTMNMMLVVSSSHCKHSMQQRDEPLPAHDAYVRTPR